MVFYWRESSYRYLYLPSKNWLFCCCCCCLNHTFQQTKEAEVIASFLGAWSEWFRVSRNGWRKYTWCIISVTMVLHRINCSAFAAFLSAKSSSNNTLCSSTKQYRRKGKKKTLWPKIRQLFWHLSKSQIGFCGFVCFDLEGLWVDLSGV